MEPILAMVLFLGALLIVVCTVGSDTGDGCADGDGGGDGGGGD
jgi:hypothetical protein